MPLLKPSNINTARKFKMARMEIYNLQTRLGQFKNRRKAKKYRLIGIALSINGHTKSPQTEILSQFRDMSQCRAIYRPNSYNVLVYHLTNTN